MWNSHSRGSKKGGTKCHKLKNIFSDTKGNVSFVKKRPIILTIKIAMSSQNLSQKEERYFPEGLRGPVQNIRENLKGQSKWQGLWHFFPL